MDPYKKIVCDTVENVFFFIFLWEQEMCSKWVVSVFFLNQLYMDHEHT